MGVTCTGVGVLTSTQVSGKLFRVVLRGYAKEDVDTFLNRIAKTLWEWEAGRKGELTPSDVEQQTFRVALRGYAEQEVDQFLDEVVQTLREYQRRKIERLSTPGLEAAESAPVETPEVLQPPAPRPDAIPIPAEPTEPAVAKPPVTPPPPTVPPASTVTRLIVTRTAEGGGRPYTVLLDDKPLGKVSPGATERFEIPTGMHWVTVKARKERSNTQVIEPHQGDQITLTCGPAAGDQFDDLGRKMEGIVLELAE